MSNAPFFTIFAVFVTVLLPAFVAAVFGGGSWMLASAFFGGLAVVMLLVSPFAAFAVQYEGFGILRPLFGPTGDMLEPSFALMVLSFCCMVLALRHDPIRRSWY